MNTFKKPLRERINSIRHHVPFWYWIIYDIVLYPFILYGMIYVSFLFVIPLIMLGIAIFFDINEAMLKYG